MPVEGHMHRSRFSLITSACDSGISPCHFGQLIGDVVGLRRLCRALYQADEELFRANGPRHAHHVLSVTGTLSSTVTGTASSTSASTESSSACVRRLKTHTPASIVTNSQASRPNAFARSSTSPWRGLPIETSLYSHPSASRMGWIQEHAACQPGSCDSGGAKTAPGTAWLRMLALRMPDGSPDIPAPGLQFVTRVRVELEPIQSAGVGPWGERRLVPIIGGHFEGPRLRGTVLHGGADWQIVHPDSMITVDTHYGLRTEDGALIYISTHGVRVATPETAGRLQRGDPVDPTEYYFRIFATLETGSPQYFWLNQRIFVAAAARDANAVVYDLYAVS